MDTPSARMRAPQLASLAGRRCRACGRPVFGAGEVCKSRKCPEYSLIWAGDVRQKLFQNLAAYDGEVLLSAVTAPGADALPWDETRCAHRGEHKHSGRIGCRVDRNAAREWNETASERWRRLHRRARQETLRQCGPGSVVLLARVWEVQERGVLHAHPVVGYGTARQMAGARAYLERLADLAPQYGFGFVHHHPDKVKPQPALQAAAYVSSYFVIGKGHKTALAESVRSPTMPKSIVHVSVELTMETRCTMRNLRLRRLLWFLSRRSFPMDEVGAIADLLAAFPGAEIPVLVAPDRGPPLADDLHGWHGPGAHS